MGFSSARGTVIDRRTDGVPRKRNLPDGLAARERDAGTFRFGRSGQETEKLRITLASIADGIIVCDNDGCITMINPAAAELIGRRAEKGLRHPLSEMFTLFQEQTGEPLEDPVARARRTGGVAILSSGTILKRGKSDQILIEGNAAPMRDSAGERCGFVLLFRDVTQAHSSQATRLSNAKLGAAGRLAANLAHELHNPLDSVANLLYLLAGEPPASEASAKLVRMGQEEIARAIKISHTMLGLYRESAGPVRIDVRKMIEAVSDSMAEHLLGLRINLRTRFAKNLHIPGFPAELRQVFTYLMTNAAEAAGGRGKVTVTASSKKRSPAGAESGQARAQPMVSIAVTDDGPGVADSLREQLFQPFFSTKAAHGSGLGLWISQSIIVKHGGEIKIDTDTSPEHHGTTVTVSLPAAQQGSCL